jgi:tRNA pseudouridine55 synthase
VARGARSHQGAVALIDGLAVVDKPAGWTSHDVVARCRKHFGQKRVGHAGTLDPDATGVLLVGLGRVTRLMRFLTALRKSYEGEVVLGVATSTLDASGDVVATYDMSTVALDDARAAATKFVGEIDQVPPMVSAVKVGGRRLHELARKGEEVERDARRVTVHRFDVEPGPEPGVFRIAVDCSSGTYIRTLAADLGAELGGGAHLRNLRRTSVGSFTVTEAHGLDDLSVLTPADTMRDYPRVVAQPSPARACAPSSTSRASFWRSTTVTGPRSSSRRGNGPR